MWDIMEVYKNRKQLAANKFNQNSQKKESFIMKEQVNFQYK